MILYLSGMGPHYSLTEVCLRAYLHFWTTFLVPANAVNARAKTAASKENQQW